MTTSDVELIKDVLAKDDRVIFAYLHGSFCESEDYRDIDIAVYSIPRYPPHHLSADIKVALYERTGIAPDFFDIRIINNLIEAGDLFSLIFLKRMFEKNHLLADKNFDVRADFIEKYGTKYRSCEGLIYEIMT